MLSVYVELASVSALVTVTVTVVDLPLSGMGGVGIPLATARLFTAMRQLGTAGSAVIATEATRFCSATVYALVLGEKAGCGNKLEFLVWFLAIIFELMQTTGRTVENGYIKKRSETLTTSVPFEIVSAFSCGLTSGALGIDTMTV